MGDEVEGVVGRVGEGVGEEMDDVGDEVEGVGEVRVWVR